MYRHSLVVFALATASFAGPGARAQDIPKYDVEAACQRAGIALRPCIMMEQDDYDYSRAVWGSISTETKNKCIGFFQKNSGPRRYAGFKTCVATFGYQDQIQGRLNQSDKFRY